MDMSPQQQQDSLRRGGGQQEIKRRTKSQSYRRQSAPSLVITKALTRSKTLSRETFLVPVCPETCSLVQSLLTGSDRSFLLHGHAQLKTGMQTQDRHLFLFNDILVVTKAKSANHFKQKARVCVCEMWTASCMEEVCEGSTNPERSFVMGWPTCNCVATFSSAEHKQKWLSLLKSQIKEGKEKEEPKTIPLRVYGKGINTFAVIKTLPVSNCDSTNEVIRLALQQFGIIGNVKDFQLWVISKRDNTPYPLIGHEFPFSIHMSHMRPSVSQGGGRDIAAPPEDKQKATQMEQLQVHKQCQFILKPRPTETLQQHISTDFTQKPFKRRRSLIAWAFWRGSSSHLNELTLTGAARGCLFGQPLSAVCADDALPKPVMDMLAFLYHEGSWTRGIFRRPAGARGVRELRDSLDTGEFQLSLTRDHIFVIAGVFKDFLRSIPGSLLCCELHEEWMDVLEEEEEEGEQVQDIQRMICRLPKENALLLRYVLAMLHGIQGNAHENQMTSFNLSVCIAPSILWPPGAPCSPEVEGEGTKKVCELVKFMIDHCQQILGEAPSSLFGGPAQRLSTEETGSDLWTYPLTDSSYDSLENELENSSGESPGGCSRSHFHSKPLQGSLDSILTFSDCDQDVDPNQTDSLHGLDLPRGRRHDQDPSPVDSSPALDSSDGQLRLRRRSEPAIAYVAKFQPCVRGSADRGSADGEDKLFKKSPKGQTRSSGAEPVFNLHGGRSAALEASSSSLSSTPNSLDSLDSLTSDLTYMMRQGPTKIHPPSNSGHRDHGNSPKESPPGEPLSRGPLKGCMGLHPNSWLKKDRRLSLTQQDNMEREEENKTGGGAMEKSISLIPEEGKLMSSSQLKPQTSCTHLIDAGGGLVSLRPGHKSQHMKHNSSSPPSHHRSTGSLQFPKAPWFYSSDPPLKAGQLSAIHHPPEPQRGLKELKQSSPPVFYKHGGLSLSLFKRHKSHSTEEQRNAKLFQRRGSEPGQQIVAPILTRVRLPSDPGLKVSEVDSDAHLCLSPSATKVVKEYFSTHPHSNPHSSQQVALALVESHREWLKRCSDPKAEPDLDQLLFAEESYV